MSSFYTRVKRGCPSIDVCRREEQRVWDYYGGWDGLAAYRYPFVTAPERLNCWMKLGDAFRSKCGVSKDLAEHAAYAAGGELHRLAPTGQRTAAPLRSISLATRERYNSEFNRDRDYRNVVRRIDRR